MKKRLLTPIGSRKIIQNLRAQIKKLKEENEALKSVAYGTCPPDLWDETFNSLFPDAKINRDEYLKRSSGWTPHGKDQKHILKQKMGDRWEPGKK